MKRLILGSFSILMMSVAALPTAVKAQPIAVNSGVLIRNSTPTSEAQPRPFDLVYLAYQGYLSNEGIPSNEALVEAYEAGRVTPKVLVESAVNANRLPPAAISDKDYLSAVGFQLRELRETDRGR